MNHETESMTAARKASRRDFIKKGAGVASATALAGAMVPHVHAAQSDVIRLALIGCGGRGSGAAVNAFESHYGPVKLVAMADLFENRLKSAHKTLSARFEKQMDVPAERQFLGFDAYKHAIDAVGPGGIAMLTGYAGFRPGQLEYAVEKGCHVFMEKSFAADVPGLRRVIAAGEAAKKKNLKIAAGLMCRHSVNRQELIRRIKDGALGEIQLVRAYRMQPGPMLVKKPPKEEELAWQLRHFTSFYWVSGGLYAEMDIHQIDEICWLMDDVLPEQAHGVGGRAPDSVDCSQNLDSFSVEFTFPNGAKATDVVRYLSNCHNEFATYVHGTKCAAQFSGNGHLGDVKIFKGQRCVKDEIAWKAEEEEVSPWQAEWDQLLEAVRTNREHNEAKRAAMSNLADIMGRAAMHMGKIVTREQALASKFQFCPEIDRMTWQSTPPVKADENGRYPAPVPGKWVEL